MQHFFRYCAFCFSLVGCIGTDIENEVDPILKISNVPNTIRVTGSYLFTSEYIDQLAQRKSVPVIWNSSDPSVLIIDQDGMAMALSEGEVTVFVEFDEVADFVEVEVLPSLESIRISDFLTILPTGDTFPFEALYNNLDGQPDDSQPITWSSSSPHILSVDQEGNVTALSEGTGHIHVRAGNVADTVTVESTPELIVVDEEVRITQFTSTIDLDQSFTFEANFFDNMGQPQPSVNINWASSDNSIIAINDEGVAMAKLVGKVVITASVGTVKDLVEVEVPQPPESVLKERMATLQGHSGYNISGTAILKQGNGDLLLELSNIVTDGPGPYVYLSNSSNNVSSGINLGKATDGSMTINVTAEDSDIALDQYDFVVIWCEPFSVTLGSGELSN